MSSPIVWPPLRASTLDVNGYVTGQAAAYSKLVAIPRWSSPGGWTMTVPASAPEVARLQEGCGLVIELHLGNGVYRELMSGPVTQIVEVQNAEKPYGEITYAGEDDLALLNDFLTWPSTSRAVTAQDIATYWGEIPSGGSPAGDGPIAEVVRRAVQQNVIYSPFERQVRRMSLADDFPGGTAAVSLRSRYEPLLQFVQRSIAPYNLGCYIDPDIKRMGDKAQVWRIFTLTTPTDRSATIRWSYASQNLLGHEWRRAKPGYTRGIIGAAGEGTARQMAEAPIPSLEVLWARRIEAFIDRSDVNTMDALTTAVAEAVAEGQLASAAGLSVDVLDTPSQRFGVHYFLGDYVTVEIRGIKTVDQIREVEIVHEPGQAFRVRPLIGPEGTLHPSRPLTPRILALIDSQLKRKLRT